MYAKRTDINQKQIVEALRSMGANVYLLHEIGRGIPDILIAYKGVTILAEIKRNTNARLTDAQIQFWKNWQGGKLVRINNIDEAIALIKNMV